MSRAARIQAGATGPGARGPAPRARAHAAPLPAVVRVLDARRLDRHARRRPLRHAPHAHRRLRRVGARVTPRGCVGEPPPARLGRRAEPGPAADRLGGHPRRDHRGVDARAGRARASGSRRRSCSTRSNRGAQAVRALSQSGLHPSNCRLLDPGEAALTGRRAGRPGAARARLRVRRPRLGPWMARALELCARPRRRARASEARAAAARRRARRAEGAWRDAFLQAPYLRDTLVAGGHPRRDLRDRDHVGSLRRPRRDACASDARAALGGEGAVTCRLTHVYPDGAAPYFTVLAPARRGRRARAVGRDQGRRRPRRSPRRAARSPTTTRSGATTGPGTTASDPSRSPRPCARRRRRVDPAGILNPGVLIDP